LHADDLNTFPAAFVNGMTSPPRARALGDTGARDPFGWVWGNDKHRADAAVLVFAASKRELEDAITSLPIPPTRKGAERPSYDIHLEVRERGDKREPFGFRDGVSQPIIPNTPAARHHQLPDQAVAAGEFVLGYRDNRKYFPPVPTVPAERERAACLPVLPNGQHDLGKNSSFFVIRQLRQDVDDFNKYCRERASDHGVTPEYIAAKMLGRWPNGSSLVRNPHQPGGDADNEFRFGRDDPDGLACPRGAHIRRANARDALHADLPNPLRITNRHRILRVGRPYVAPDTGTVGGLLFMCLNAEIERQFEFLQESWVMRPSFDGLHNETDPLLGPNDGRGVMTVPTEDGPLCLSGLRNFVTPIGGGYFWLPSRSAVDFLS
jgi:deferrochelatase/peroxidase EfeB